MPTRTNPCRLLRNLSTLHDQQQATSHRALEQGLNGRGDAGVERGLSAALLEQRFGTYPDGYSISERRFLFDHLVGAVKQRRRSRQAERLGRLEIDHKLDLGGKVDW